MTAVSHRRKCALNVDSFVDEQEWRLSDVTGVEEQIIKDQVMGTIKDPGTRAWVGGEGGMETASLHQSLDPTSRWKLQEQHCRTMANWCKRQKHLAEIQDETSLIETLLFTITTEEEEQKKQE